MIIILPRYSFSTFSGFLAILRSDRGAEFVIKTIKTLNEMLGIDHVLGSACHPQTQGYIIVIIHRYTTKLKV